MPMNYEIWRLRRDRLIVSAPPSKSLHGHDQSVPAESPGPLVKEHDRVPAGSFGYQLSL